MQNIAPSSVCLLFYGSVRLVYLLRLIINYQKNAII